MATFNKKQSEVTASILAYGGVGVLPTDTIYGIVGSALDAKAVERIYRLRKRNPKKPVIILIGSMEDLALFGVALAPKAKKMLSKWWPGKVSVVLKLPAKVLKKYRYLHRGTGTLAFRMPRSVWLRALLAEAGPLVAPSANIEGEPPALTVKEAKKYFAGGADFYLDGGTIDSKPSTLVTIEREKAIVLRQGAVRILPRL